MCKTVIVLIRTNRHRPDLPQYRADDSRTLSAPTQDTRVITDAALQLLDQLFKPGFRYKKMGVVLTDIVPAAAQQLDLFNVANDLKSKKLMQALDDINNRFGEQTIHSALSTLNKKRKKKSEDDDESNNVL